MDTHERREVRPPVTADFRMALLELLRQYQGEPEGDALREGLRWLAQQLMEVEVSVLIGAHRYERTPSRTTYRNGHRPRRWDTRVGTIELQIPKLRRGSYFPSLLPAAAARGAGLAGRGAGGLRVWGEHPEGGRAGAGAGHRGPEQERGLPHLRRAGRAHGALSEPAA